MRVTLPEAHQLALDALLSIGCETEEAQVTADHLLDAGLRGMTFGSLARVLAIGERLAAEPGRRAPISVLHETPVSTLLDGGDHVGYYVAHQATTLAIEKARKSGMAIVGARNTWYTGLFAYYMEMVTRAGFVGMAVGNGPAMVAPEGAAEARLGTNPTAWGFPADPDPVIWDIGTCSIMQGDLMLHKRTGESLPDGLALDRDGKPTNDPAAALEGAILPWGGHKGSGLSMVVQMLGAMCGGPVISPGISEMAYLVLVIDPKILMPDGDYASRVGELRDRICSARPRDGGAPVRMPFQRSAEERRRRQQDQAIEVPEAIVTGLRGLIGRRNQQQ